MCSCGRHSSPRRHRNRLAACNEQQGSARPLTRNCRAVQLLPKRPHADPHLQGGYEETMTNGIAAFCVGEQRHIIQISDADAAAIVNAKSPPNPVQGPLIDNSVGPQGLERIRRNCTEAKRCRPYRVSSVVSAMDILGKISQPAQLAALRRQQRLGWPTDRDLLQRRPHEDTLVQTTGSGRSQITSIPRERLRSARYGTFRVVSYTRCRRATHLDPLDERVDQIVAKVRAEVGHPFEPFARGNPFPVRNKSNWRLRNLVSPLCG